MRQNVYYCGVPDEEQEEYLVRAAQVFSVDGITLNVSVADDLLFKESVMSCVRDEDLPMHILSKVYPALGKRPELVRTCRITDGKSETRIIDGEGDDVVDTMRMVLGELDPAAFAFRPSSSVSEFRDDSGKPAKHVTRFMRVLDRKSGEWFELNLPHIHIPGVYYLEMDPYPSENVSRSPFSGSRVLHSGRVLPVSSSQTDFDRVTEKLIEMYVKMRTREK